MKVPEFMLRWSEWREGNGPFDPHPIFPDGFYWHKMSSGQWVVQEPGGTVIKQSDWLKAKNFGLVGEFTSIEDAQPLGTKADDCKVMMGAMPPHAELAVARVLTFGAKKYSRGNWAHLENSDERYMDAALRHINAYRRGEQTDSETGENHLAHAICCLMFILEKCETV